LRFEASFAASFGSQALKHPSLIHARPNQFQPNHSSRPRLVAPPFESPTILLDIASDYAPIKREQKQPRQRNRQQMTKKYALREQWAQLETKEVDWVEAKHKQAVSSSALVLDYRHPPCALPSRSPKAMDTFAPCCCVSPPRTLADTAMGQVQNALENAGPSPCHCTSS
jgi:hypothetical protein